MSIVADQTSSFDEMTLLYTRFLRLIAILPLEGRDYTSPSMLALLLFTLVMSCINWSMFLCYVINEFMPPIDAITEAAVVLGLNTRFYILLWHRRKVVSLLAECREIWNSCNEEGRRMVRKLERKVRILFIAILGNALFGHVVFSVTAIVFTIKARAFSPNGSAVYILPYKWYAENNENFWPGYEFNFALQTFIVPYVSVVSASVDSFAPLLIMLGSGFFRDLQLRLRRTGEDNGDDKEERSEEELVACLRQHQRILSYCSRIDEVTQTLFFTQLLTTVYNMSLIGVKLVGTDPDKFNYLCVGLFNLGQLFICQWTSDHLIDESKAIATAAYDASFSWLKRRKGSWLVLMIMRAQRPVQMTAAGLLGLSLENFGALLKGAISFFTVLRSFT